MTGRLDAVPRCPVCRALAETKTPLQAGRAEIRQRNRTENLGAEPAQASQPPTDGDVVRRLSLATHLWFFSFLEASSECLSRGSCHRSPLHAFFRPFIPRPRPGTEFRVEHGPQQTGPGRPFFIILYH